MSNKQLSLVKLLKDVFSWLLNDIFQVFVNDCDVWILMEPRKWSTETVQMFLNFEFDLYIITLSH